MRIAFLLLTLLCSSAFAQTTSTVQVSMPWSKLASVSKVDATFGGTVIPGITSPFNLAVDFTNLGTISATFPIQAAAYTVTGVELTVCASGTWTCRQPMILDQAIAINVPANGTLSLALNIATANLTLTATAPPPPPPPPPPPTTGCTASAVGMQITGKTGEQIVLKDCTIWTVVTGGAWPKVLRNGVDTVQPYEQKFSYLYVSPKGFADVMSPANGSLCWISGKWTGSGC